MLKDEHKKLYNIYLEAMAYKNNRGYRKRVNFENIDKETEDALVKINHFLSRTPNISARDYFRAGFEYSVDTWLPIGFFKTRKAFVYYTRFMRNKQTANPDDPEILQSFMEGLKFLASFIKE